MRVEARVKRRRTLFGASSTRTASRQARVERAHDASRASIVALERDAGDLAERVHAGVGASGAGDRHRRAVELASASSSSPWIEVPAACRCQPTNAGAVVGERQLEDGAHLTRPRGREPGLHHRQALRAERTRLGLVGRQRDVEQRVKRHVEARAARRCDRRSTRRRRRGRRPRVATCIVSRVDPPVVSTSSTTSTRSVSASVKPRRSVSTPSCRSAKMRAHAERAADLVADDDAAERRRQHDGRRAGRASRSAMARPSASACAGCCSTSAHCR